MEGFNSKVTHFLQFVPRLYSEMPCIVHYSAPKSIAKNNNAIQGKYMV